MILRNVNVLHINLHQWFWFIFEPRIHLLQLLATLNKHPCNMTYVQPSYEVPLCHMTYAFQLNVPHIVTPSCIVSYIIPEIQVASTWATKILLVLCDLPLCDGPQGRICVGYPEGAVFPFSNSFDLD